MKNGHVNVYIFLIHPHGIFCALGVASRAECGDLPRNQHWGLKQIFLLAFRFVETRVCIILKEKFLVYIFVLSKKKKIYF